MAIIERLFVLMKLDDHWVADDVDIIMMSDMRDAEKVMKLMMF